MGEMAGKLGMSVDGRQISVLRKKNGAKPENQKKTYKRKISAMSHFPIVEEAISVARATFGSGTAHAVIARSGRELESDRTTASKRATAAAKGFLSNSYSSQCF